MDGWMNGRMYHSGDVGKRRSAHSHAKRPADALGQGAGRGGAGRCSHRHTERETGHAQRVCTPAMHVSCLSPPRQAEYEVQAFFPLLYGLVSRPVSVSVCGGEAAQSSTSPASLIQQSQSAVDATFAMAACATLMADDTQGWAVGMGIQKRALLTATPSLYVCDCDVVFLVCGVQGRFWASRAECSDTLPPCARLCRELPDSATYRQPR